MKKDETRQVFMEKQMEVAVNDGGCVMNKIKQLVGELKDLHEHRLRCLEQDSSGNHSVLDQVSRRRPDGTSV